MTKRLATSGAQSPREIWRKTRSGRALLRDLEKETSVVRKTTWAMLAVVRRAALWRCQHHKVVRWDALYHSEILS